MTGLVKERLREKGLRENALEYVEFHSTENLKLNDARSSSQQRMLGVGGFT